MTLKRLLVFALDRPLLRALLAQFATIYARQLLGRNVCVKYDNGWFHSLDGICIPDREGFDIYRPHVERWPEELETYYRDAREMWFFGYSPKSGDTIVDVGAGMGEDVLAFAREVGESGRVIAIEAHPTTFRQLQRLCELNRFTQVKPLQLAIMDRECTVSIENTEAWESNTISTTSHSAVHTVNAVTIDELCIEHKLEKIDFLKMNIEGAEKFAIQGMRESIERINCICICCHDFRTERGDGDFYKTRGDTIAFLEGNGFRVFSRPDHPHDYVRDHIFGLRER